MQSCSAGATTRPTQEDEDDEMLSTETRGRPLLLVAEFPGVASSVHDAFAQLSVGIPWLTNRSTPHRPHRSPTMCPHPLPYSLIITVALDAQCAEKGKSSKISSGSARCVCVWHAAMRDTRALAGSRAGTSLCAAMCYSSSSCRRVSGGVRERRHHAREIESRVGSPRLRISQQQPGG
ncbi:hypothetical protein BDZ90DRAFT_18797 [Jaminaea rosea]|uniref:Uncharacterized protein n=1 Tax=Jaminaea rosea TaxID=1569628 RepID=A0A316UZ71_9BASI|nr:hypothetical protein BDZ90DRAFT_18797 [Jaminaea rosea]PWN30607.1 hypothetical protein BDZ90DRAFT_18797 [Jaminaea rosea]